jgi:hypothetical protein
VVFKISLEVIIVLLFLLGKATIEKGVVAFPAFFGAFLHSLFSSFVVVTVNVFAGIEFLNFAEISI